MFYAEQNTLNVRKNIYLATLMSNCYLVPWFKSQVIVIMFKNNNNQTCFDNFGFTIPQPLRKYQFW